MSDPTNAFDANADLWDELAKDAPDEMPEFEELPFDTWVIAETASNKNGRAAASVRTTSEKKLKIFNVGLLTIGGAEGIDIKRHRNRLCYYDSFIEKGPDDKSKGPVAGRFAGFLNTLFAPGVGEDLRAPKGASKEEKKEAEAARSAARWKGTMAMLKSIAEGEHGEPQIEGDEISLAAYDGKVARYLAGLTVFYLQENPKRLLFKTKKDSYKSREGEQVTKVKVGSIEDLIPANIEKRKVEFFEAEEGGVEF